jgi:tetratricopeptide (TPR) repeat protein
MRRRYSFVRTGRGTSPSIPTPLRATGWPAATMAMVVTASMLAPMHTSQANVAFAPAATETDTSDDARQRAKHNVELGARLYGEAKYAEALEAFERAAAAYPLPDFHYNIGLCHERLGNPRKAIVAFEAYLQGKPDAPDAPGVRDRIEALRTQLEQSRAEAMPVEPAPAITTQPRPPAVPLHARTTDARSRPQPVRTAPETDALPERDRDRGRAMIVSGATLLGLGTAIGIAGGVTFGIYAERRSDEVDRVLDQGNPNDRTMSETRELADQGDLYRTLQLASIGTGVAVTVTGLALLLAGRRRAREVALAPAVGAGQAGMTMEGRF